MLWAFIGVGAGVLVAWQAYDLGRSQANAVEVGGVEGLDPSAREQIDYLTTRNNELIESNAILRQSAEIERIAHEEVRRSLQAAQQQATELRQELVFYRNLMSPSDNQAGLHIEALSVTPDILPNIFHYELVLTLVRGKDRLASGQLLFKLSGQRGGESVTLTLADVTPDQAAGVRFRFKYFQSVNGQLELPEGFVPESLELEAVSSVKGLDSVSRQFDWQELIAGEVEVNVGKD